MFDFSYIIELLSPKRDDHAAMQKSLDRFSERYEKSLAMGCGVSVPDNPMGQLRLGLFECLEMRNLQVDPERVIMNLNTFHSKDELDAILNKAKELGVKKLLVIRGDGGPHLPKLAPESIGGMHSVVTTHDLLRYINRTYKDDFLTGAAFNPYKEMSFEFPHMQKKIDAGAKFVITQPIIGRDKNVDKLAQFNVPIVVEAWMSENIGLFTRSIGREVDASLASYNPVENLNELHKHYPDSCIYLALLKFSDSLDAQLPKLNQ